MLEPSKSAPDYEKELARFKKDPSEWGIPADQVDMMQSTRNAPQPGSPQEAAAKKSK